MPYKDRSIDEHRVDFIIERCVIVELKSVPMVKELHRMQVRWYLKATGLRLGYVMNFNEGSSLCLRVFVPSSLAVGSFNKPPLPLHLLERRPVHRSSLGVQVVF